MQDSRSSGGRDSSGVGDGGSGGDRGRCNVVGLCCCASDAKVQAVGTREQDEAQIPCCYPHLPNNMCVLRGGTAEGVLTTRRD